MPCLCEICKRPVDCGYIVCPICEANVICELTKLTKEGSAGQPAADVSHPKAP